MTSFLVWIRTFLFHNIVVLIIVGVTLISWSCGGGTSPQLTTIAIQPQNVTVAGTPTIVYTALGRYANTPGMKDITAKVQWKTSAPSIVAFSDSAHPNYLLPSGSGCGTNLGVMAVVYTNPDNPSSGQAVVGNATMNVECVTGAGTDFSLSSIPTVVSGSAGSTVTYAINVTANSGTPTVALQITGALPAGTTTNFNPVSVIGTGSSTLTVSTSGTTAVGLYHLRITGTDASGSLTLGVNLNIT
jgi:hypothetical protein